MKLLNPIYDTVFKFLMEDIEIARGLISLIIEEEVTELMPAPQESTTTKFKIKYSQLELQRLDYVAIIKTIDKQGNEIFEKVSIEVQKSPFVPELSRFRKYVGEKYSRKSEYKNKNGVQVEYLPIKTIYFVDKTFNKHLPVILRRKGEYYDVLEQKKYDGKKDKYVELLNHDSWYIQVAKLPTNLKNELLQVLSVFAPWMRNEKNERYIEIPEKIESIKKYQLFTKIINRLQLAGNDKNLETSLELEISYENYIEKAHQEKELAQKREKEAQNRFAKAVKKMQERSFTVSEIAQDFGITEKEVKRLLKI